MYLKSKQVAFLGLLTAFSVVLIVISGVLEFSTLFFLALAAFCVGVAIQEAGIQSGCAVFLATVLLSVFLAPNKLYCITYSALAAYILIIEIVIRFLTKKKVESKSALKIYLIKYLVFNLIYLPILIFLPKLIYHGEFTVWIYVIAVLSAQIVFYIFDRVYFECMHYYLKVLRHQIKMD